MRFIGDILGTTLASIAFKRRDMDSVLMLAALHW